MFCHVVWAVVRQVRTGEAEAGADTFVTAVWRAAAERRARFPAFPRLPGSSVWRVLHILEVDYNFFFLQKTTQDASNNSVVDLDPHDPHVFGPRIRILPFSHKGVELTEIVLAKKICTQNFNKKLNFECACE